MVEIIHEDAFEELVLKSDKPVLVDFFADWCGPCKMMMPVLEELSVEKAEQLTIYKVNVDEDKAIAKKYHVMGIPNMILFKNGKKAASVIGSKPKDALWKKLEKSL